jgi:hypothetical protein
MKRIFFLVFVLICVVTTNVSAASDEIIAPTPAERDATVEKPKPGSKRWLKSQKHTRNPRRRKYPKMRRWQTYLQDVTIGPVSFTSPQATHPETISVTAIEQNGVVVVHAINS